MVRSPGADALARRWDGELGVPGLPLHVTVMYPFVPDAQLGSSDLEDLAQLSRSLRPFAYELGAVDRFPGVLYLTPTPADPFVALTDAVHARWPDQRPYNGEFAGVVPHVTLALGDEPEGLADAARSVLPLSGRAEELELLSFGTDGAWAPRHRFRLGAAEGLPVSRRD
jgi:2'-5' RNA ligase